MAMFRTWDEQRNAQCIFRTLIDIPKVEVSRTHTLQQRDVKNIHTAGFIDNKTKNDVSEKIQEACGGLKRNIAKPQESPCLIVKLSYNSFAL